MLLDGGIIKIYNLSDRSTPGAMPHPQLELVTHEFFGERNIGYNRQYAAKGVNEQIDMLVRTWRNNRIHIGMYAILNDESQQYRIDNVQLLTDEDGLKVCDLSLSRLESCYDITGKITDNR